MQAAVYHTFGGPIRVEEVDVPAVPPDGIILQVKATGICRSDWHGWKGHDDDIVQHGLPFVPGHEVSGVITEIGANVYVTASDDDRLLKVGDRVVVPFLLSCGSCMYCHDDHRPTVCSNQKQPGFTQFGSFAEYLAVPRAERNVTRLPDCVSFVQAAALGCRFTTAYRAIVEQGQLLEETKRSGKQVVLAVFGCGGLGLSCIMIAKAVAPELTRILAVDVNPEALRKARELGATDCVLTTRRHDSTSESLLADTLQQVLELTNGQGAHITVDAAGFSETCEAAIACTRRGGRMIQVGLPIDTGKPPPRVPMGLVASRELELVGSHGFAAADALPKLLSMIASHQLDPNLLVEREVTLEEGAKILEDMDRKSPLGIAVITRFREEPSSRL